MNHHRKLCVLFTGLAVPLLAESGSLPEVSTENPSEVSFVHARLNATVDPNGLETEAWFEWGVVNNPGELTGPQAVGAGQDAVPVSCVISGLLPGVAYFCRAVGSNASGRAEGNSHTFETRSSNHAFDITVPSDAITGTSTNSPSGQGPAMAIDDTASTTYVNFDEQGAGVVVTPLFAGRPARALGLISAAEAPERDPASYTVEGSMDGTNFVFIASNAVSPFAGRLCIQSMAFTNALPFVHYRVTFPDVQDTEVADAMQLAEAELLPYPDLTSPDDAVGIMLPPGAVTVSGADKLVDRQLGNGKMHVASISEGHNTRVNISPALGPCVVRGFGIVASDDTNYAETFPVHVLLTGSHDGTNFSGIGNVTFATDPPTTGHEIQNWTAPVTNTPYAHFRVQFGPPASGSELKIAEFRLFGFPAATSALAAWGRHWFGSTNVDLLQDTEGDGHDNLFEFASGTNPGFSNASPVFAITCSNDLPRVFYSKDTNANGTVSWHIESSTNLLTGWADRSGTSNVVATNNPYRTIRFDPSGAAPCNEWFRLKVTIP